MRYSLVIFASSKPKSIDLLWKQFSKCKCLKALRASIHYLRLAFFSRSHLLVINLCSVGVDIHPLPYFLDSSKTKSDIDAKLSVPYSPSFLCLLPKFQKKIVSIFGENWYKWRHVPPFWVKKWQMFDASRMYRFEVKRNPKPPKDIKLGVL